MKITVSISREEIEGLTLLALEAKKLNVNPSTLKVAYHYVSYTAQNTFIGYTVELEG